jgi:hypothetical protein
VTRAEELGRGVLTGLARPETCTGDHRSIPAGADRPGMNTLPFHEIWACDFEFRAPDGE